MLKLTLDSLQKICHFIACPPWTETEIAQVTTTGAYARGADKNQALVEADLLLNDALWRILSIIDPLRLPVQDRNFATIYSILRVRLSTELQLPTGEVSEAAKAISRALLAEIDRYSDSNRKPLTVHTRQLLVDSSPNGRATCWYCGYQFIDRQVSSFLHGKQRIPDRPYYIDFVSGRGRNSSDLRIEVDHSTPVSAGGANDYDNYKLSCGWCNRYKSAIASLYDASSRPTAFRHPKKGTILTPVPFWIVRLRSSSRRCNHLAGCKGSIDAGTELVVAGLRQEGALVPGNLVTYCVQHDPIAEDRWIVNSSP